MGDPGLEMPMERPNSLLAATIMAWILGGLGLMCNVCGGAGALGAGWMTEFVHQAIPNSSPVDMRIARVESQIQAIRQSGAPDPKNLQDLEEEKTRLEAAKVKIAEVQSRTTTVSAWVGGTDAALGLLIAGIVLFGGIQAFRGVASGSTLIAGGGACKILLAILYAAIFSFYVVPLQMEYMEALMAGVTSSSASGPPPVTAGIQMGQKIGMMAWAIGMSLVHAVYCAVMIYLATRPAGKEWCRRQASV